MHAARRLPPAPGCRCVSAQKNDGLDLTCRTEHGATVSAVQYARRILPGKEQSIELGQEGDSWNVGQGLLENVDVLCQGQQGRAAALDGDRYHEPGRPGGRFAHRCYGQTCPVCEVSESRRGKRPQVADQQLLEGLDARAWTEAQVGQPRVAAGEDGSRAFAADHEEVSLIGKPFHVFAPACPWHVPKSRNGCVECRTVQWSPCERMQNVLLDTIPGSCIHVTHAQHHPLDREMVPFAE